MLDIKNLKDQVGENRVLLAKLSLYSHLVVADIANCPRVIQPPTKITITTTNGPNNFVFILERPREVKKYNALYHGAPLNR
jgi:hypothetical protein